MSAQCSAMKPIDPASNLGIGKLPGDHYEYLFSQMGARSLQSVAAVNSFFRDAIVFYVRREQVNLLRRTSDEHNRFSAYYIKKLELCQSLTDINNLMKMLCFLSATEKKVTSLNNIMKKLCIPAVLETLPTLPMHTSYDHYPMHTTYVSAGPPPKPSGFFLCKEDLLLRKTVVSGGGGLPPPLKPPLILKIKRPPPIKLNAEPSILLLKTKLFKEELIKEELKKPELKFAEKKNDRGWVKPTITMSALLISLFVIKRLLVVSNNDLNKPPIKASH